MGVGEDELSEHTLTHLYQVFYGDLELCGCGNPDSAWVLLHELLAMMPLHEGGRSRMARVAIGSDGGHHIVLSAMDRAGLIEHGGGIGGSWITPKGAWLLRAIERAGGPGEVDELVDSVGLAHDGGPCNPVCWIVT